MSSCLQMARTMPGAIFVARDGGGVSVAAPDGVVAAVAGDLRAVGA